MDNLIKTISVFIRSNEIQLNFSIKNAEAVIRIEGI